MNRRTFFRITAGLTALFSGIKAFATETPTLTSLDRVDVRRLMSEIKKYMEKCTGGYVFEPNDQKTREYFNTEVNDYLEQLRDRHAIQSYGIFNDETTNTPEMVDKHIMSGYVMIKPTGSPEFVVFDFQVLSPNVQDDFQLEGWDYVNDPLPGYEIKA